MDKQTRLSLFPEDVEKRQNPVCHFVTPLDGNMDTEVHRPTEVSLFGVSFDYTNHFFFFKSEGHFLGGVLGDSSNLGIDYLDYISWYLVFPLPRQ